MSRVYDPRDWYWLDELRGLVYSSRRQAEVEPFDAAYLEFLADKNLPTRHPGDAELAAVLAPHGLALKAEDAGQARFEIDRAMAEIERSPVLAAIIELIGPLVGGKAAALTWIGDRVTAEIVERTLPLKAAAKSDDDAKLAAARETVRLEQDELLASQREAKGLGVF